jgi:hypothetical protein
MVCAHLIDGIYGMQILPLHGSVKTDTEDGVDEDQLQRIPS